MKPIAVLMYQGEGTRELQALWQAVKHWQQQGLKVAGLLNTLDESGQKLRERVQSLTDSRMYTIMYDQGCTIKCLSA